MNDHRITSQSPLIFFIIALGFSWLFWIPAAFIDENILKPPWVILLYIGGLGPALSGICLTFLNKDKESRREYWRRVYDVKRINPRWYPVILFGYPLLSVLLMLVLNGHIKLNDSFSELLLQPFRIIPFVLYLFIFGPLPEELGWRGYALDKLQNRMNAVAASLLLGAVWATWHIPLFFMKGTYQNELGFGSAAFWRFMVSAVIISIFFTWIYNNNRSSILSAALFHFSVNLTGNVLGESSKLELIRIPLLIVIAFILVAIYGSKELSKKPDKNMLP
jgi:membrane protease YdiL (CAAX protease family)